MPVRLNAAAPSGTLRIAIIGAGLGGIGVACKLKKAGMSDFVIFEKSDGPGGTWWDNTYPGAACDVPSNFYSYSFEFQPWKRLYATQAEIAAYVQRVIDTYSIAPHLRLGTAIDSVVWDDATRTYTVTTTQGEEHVFDLVVSAVGMLNVPNYPAWPGLEDFHGPNFHTARWEHEHDLRGKRVAVVGTGSTAAQVVPAVCEIAEKTYVFQRQPGWVVPKEERELTPDELAHFAKPRNVKWERTKTFFVGEKTGAAFEKSKANARLRQTSLDFLDSAISDPELRKALTPDYPFKCKRVVRSSDFYAALNSDRAELVPRAVTRVTENGVVDADGVEHAVDVIVMATGFEAAKYLQTIDVTGRNGVRLHEAWGDEPEAFLGISYPDFPNFFMLYGPNSNSPTASIIFILETQADFVIRQARRLKRKSGASLEVRRGLHSRYNRWLQKRTTSTVWMTGCTNYQRGPTGRVVTNWPHHALLFWALTKMPTWMSSTTSPSP